MPHPISCMEPRHIRYPMAPGRTHCNCDVESFCCESEPLFLFYTTVAISPFVFSLNPIFIFASYTSTISNCLFILLTCVLRFTSRKSFLGEVNRIVFGYANQRSSGVMVAGIQIASDYKLGSPTSSSPPIKSIIPIERSGQCSIMC